MNNESVTRRGSRLQLALVALVFLLPLLAASWLYYSDSAVRPTGRTNHGTLLEPIVNVVEELDDNPLSDATAGRWALVYLLQGRCDASCGDALFKQRQTRLMLGNDMHRLVRVLLHGPEAPDTLFLEQEHAGLIALYDAAAHHLLRAARPRAAAAEGYYLLDPLGNLVMYFSPDIEPRELVDDVEHLFKLSRIG